MLSPAATAAIEEKLFKLRNSYTAVSSHLFISLSTSGFVRLTIAVWMKYFMIAARCFGSLLLKHMVHTQPLSVFAVLITLRTFGATVSPSGRFHALFKHSTGLIRWK
jgi:hypothetical protein